MKKLLVLMMLLISMTLFMFNTHACETRPASVKKFAVVHKSPLLSRLAQQAVDVSVYKPNLQPEFILGSPLFRF